MLQSSQDTGQQALLQAPPDTADHSEETPSVTDTASLILQGLATPQTSIIVADHAPTENAHAQKGTADEARVLVYAGDDAPATERRRSFTQRTVRDMTVDGLRHSFLTLTSTALGGGILAVSYVMEQVGVGLGSLMLAIGALLAYLSTVALMRISTEIGEYTYAGLFSYCAGPKAGPILDAMMFIFGNGCCINYFVFLGDFISALVVLVAPDAPSIFSSRWVVIIAAAVIVAPLALQKELAALRHMTPVSILSLLYVAAVIAARCASYYSEHANAPDHADYGEPKVVVLSLNVFNAFAICLFAFNCHINVVPVAGRLVRPTKQRIQRVASWVNVLQLAFYLLIGVTGYLTFLAKTPGDILIGFKANDPFMAVGRVLLSLTMVIAIAINMNPTIRSGLQIHDYFFPNKPVLLASPRASPMSSPQTSPQSSPVMPRMPNNFPTVPSPASSGALLPLANEPACPRISLTLACMVMQVSVAIVVPSVADVIGLLGATVATAMMMVIPAYAIGKALPYSIGNRCQQAMLLLFACFSVASVPIKVLQMVGVLHA